MDRAEVAAKLRIVAEARAAGRTATEAARLVGWSRATLYRHQAASQGDTPIKAPTEPLAETLPDAV